MLSIGDNKYIWNTFDQSPVVPLQHFISIVLEADVDERGSGFVVPFAQFFEANGWDSHHINKPFLFLLIWISCRQFASFQVEELYELGGFTHSRIQIDLPRTQDIKPRIPNMVGLQIYTFPACHFQLQSVGQKYWVISSHINIKFPLLIADQVCHFGASLVINHDLSLVLCCRRQKAKVDGQNQLKRRNICPPKHFKWQFNILIVNYSIHQPVSNQNQQFHSHLLRELVLQTPMNNQSILSRAAEKLAQSTLILIGAGAGMGRDSGLPDFRGNEGFWNNYPPYRNKFDFYSCANPEFLVTNPHLFWGFYGSRLIMYREKKPHKGFHILKKLCQRAVDHFVITSNVDGHFQYAFKENEIYEVHGSIHYLQCSSCLELSQNKFIPEIDYTQMKCKNLPTCSRCLGYLRPNILMFGDWDWISDRSDRQQENYDRFLKRAQNHSRVGEKLAILEIGCGTAVPAIRNMCQRLYFKDKQSILIRINPEEESNKHQFMDESRYFHLQLGAEDALTLLWEQIAGNKKR